MDDDGSGKTIDFILTTLGAIGVEELEEPLIALGLVKSRD